MKKIISAMAVTLLFSFNLSAQIVKTNNKEQQSICTHQCDQTCEQNCEHIKNHNNRHLNCDDHCKATHDCALFSKEQKQQHKQHCKHENNTHRKCISQRNA